MAISTNDWMKSGPSMLWNAMRLLKTSGLSGHLPGQTSVVCCHVRKGREGDQTPAPRKAVLTRGTVGEETSQRGGVERLTPPQGREVACR